MTTNHRAEVEALAGALDVPGGAQFGAGGDLPGWRRLGDPRDYGRGCLDPHGREYLSPSGTVYRAYPHDPQRAAKVASHVRVAAVPVPLGGLVDVCWDEAP